MSDIKNLSLQDREKAAFRNNPNDSGVDKRVADLDAHGKLDDIVTAIGGIGSGVIKGTDDGSAGGTEYIFVNNQRLQILAAHDRDQAITYADFGTKNQRVTQIDYTSPTFSGITARKSISYTLVGTKYRRDSITWSIV